MKRSKDEIIEQILKTCMEPATKTRVVYQANLNFKTVNTYLVRLTKAGCLEVTETPLSTYSTYHTTSKGAKVLEQIEFVRGLLNSEL
jgi:predicted transcriptional regulator